MVGKSALIINDGYYNKLSVNRLSVNELRSNNIREQDIYNYMNSWFEAVESGNPKLPASFFASDAVLFATLSDQFRDTPELIQEYFNYFVLLPNLRNDLQRYEIKKIDNNGWGFYSFVNWTWGDAIEPTTVRMSFIIRVNVINKLEIVHLNSGVLPTPQ